VKKDVTAIKEIKDTDKRRPKKRHIAWNMC